MGAARTGPLGVLTAEGDLLSLDAALELVRVPGSGISFLGSNYYWGGNLKTGDAGQHFTGNGISTSAKVVGIDQDSEITVTRAGTLKTLGWTTTAAAATTIFKVFKNGLLAETVTLTGVQGADSTLTTTVIAGDTLAIEFDAGAGPLETLISLSVE